MNLNKMYICPICYKAFKDPTIIATHSLQCCREHNPNHQSKPAPCKGNITERQINEDVSNFFASFRKD